MKANWKDKELISAVVKESYCYREVLTSLGLRAVGANNETLKRWIGKYQLDISHFDPYRGKMEKLRKFNSIPLIEIIEGNHPQYKTYHLKLRLLKEGIKQNVCEECGQDGTWNGKPLKIQLDHIDGTSNNHKIDNLKMLCPNCHTQTPTFAGKKR